MADALVEEIRHVCAFLAAQNAITGNCAALRVGQAMSLVKKISQSKLTLADAAAVSNVIAQGPWSEAEKEQLAAAVALAAQQKDPQKIAGARRPLQRMSAFAAYLTQTQLNFLSSDRPAAEKVHYAADVMVRWAW
ncbi:unnamed protein product [Effrenium voratum]|nr:unnamed protein product [Effrenium voratum]